jgi:predicted RNase H-like HicB family nuclease
MMDALIWVRKEGKWYVAEDLVTNVADQGTTERAAVRNLKKGLESHYRTLVELAPKSYKTAFLKLEVEKHAKTSGALG